MNRAALALLLATGLTASPAMAQQQHDQTNQAAAQQREHAGHMMQGDNADMMAACHQRMTMMHDMMGQMAAQQDMAQHD